MRFADDLGLGRVRVDQLGHIRGFRVPVVDQLALRDKLADPAAQRAGVPAAAAAEYDDVVAADALCHRLSLLSRLSSAYVNRIMSLAVRAASTVGRQPAVGHVLGLPDPARSVPRIGVVNVDQVSANPAARAAMAAMGA